MFAENIPKRKLFIPRDTETCQRPIVVVGLPELGCEEPHGPRGGGGVGGGCKVGESVRGKGN